MLCGSCDFHSGLYACTQTWEFIRSRLQLRTNIVLLRVPGGLDPKASLAYTLLHQMSFLGVTKRWAQPKPITRDHLNGPQLSCQKSAEKLTADATSANSGILSALGTHEDSSATLNTQQLRLFVGTWNVGGRAPTAETMESVHEWLIDVPHPNQPPPDIYVLGFQEIVPLNIGNILRGNYKEDGKNGGVLSSDMWEAFISETLNQSSRQRPTVDACCDTKHSKDRLSSSVSMLRMSAPQSAQNLCVRDDDNNNNKSASPVWSRDNHNCGSDKSSEKDYGADSTIQNKYDKYIGDILEENFKQQTQQGNAQNYGLSCDTQHASKDHIYSASLFSNNHGKVYAFTPSIKVLSRDEFKERIREDDEDTQNASIYTRIARKQMVGLFITIWVRKNLRQYITNVQVSSVGCGVMNRLGNKGSVSISLSVHETSFCFICSHLRSGQRADDVIRRNVDAQTILHRTRFPNFEQLNPNTSFQLPRSILAHDRIILLGDLNYRLNIASEELRTLLHQQDWKTLVERDELKDATRLGGVLEGWREGSIYFAPTYKYLINSNTYWIEKDKEGLSKRRSPAWCDRILWHGKGLKQLSYTRCESKHSDHRPVRSTFVVEIEVLENT